MRRFFSALLVALLVTLLCCAPAFAATDKLEAAFDDLSGEGKYLGKDWAWKYDLDIQKLGLLDATDSMGNAAANLLFNMDRDLAYTCMKLYYVALNFNIVTILGQETDNVQSSLVNSIFKPLLIFGYAAMAFHMIRWLLRRNVTAIFGEIFRVLCVVILSTLLVTNTSRVLTGITGFARELGLSVVMQINGKNQTSSADFAAETAGILWGDLIHRPWLALEFEGDGQPSVEEYEKILSKHPGSDDRQKAVKAYMKDHTGAFSKSIGWSRLGSLILYFIPFLIKLAIYVLCAFLMIAFQLAALFYAITGPIILLLSLFDVFGGPRLVVSWGTKIIETQIGVILISLILGLVILTGNAITKSGAISTLGWLGSAIMQTALVIVLFLLRKKIFGFFRKFTANPAALPQALLNFSAAGMVREFQQEARDRQALSRQRQQADYIAEAREQQRTVNARTIEVRQLQVEKLQREKEWDDAHPNANPHDKYYHHYYNPRPEADETPPTQQERKEKPVRRPRTVSRPEDPQRAPSDRTPAPVHADPRHADAEEPAGEERPTQQKTRRPRITPDVRKTRQLTDNGPLEPTPDDPPRQDTEWSENRRPPRTRKPKRPKSPVPRPLAEPDRTPDVGDTQGTRRPAGYSIDDPDAVDPPRAPAKAPGENPATTRRPRVSQIEPHPDRRPEEPAAPPADQHRRAPDRRRDTPPVSPVARPQLKTSREKDPWEGRDKPEPWDDGSSGPAT